MKRLRQIFKKLTELALFMLLMIGFVACQPAGMVVTDAWGRPSPMAADNAAFYLTITNKTGEDDALIAVKTDLCQMVELHEGFIRENGVMGMRPVEGGKIALPTNQSVELKPGGLHVMCMGKKSQIEAGQSVSLDLLFESGREVVLTVPIQNR